MRGGLFLRLQVPYGSGFLPLELEGRMPFEVAEPRFSPPDDHALQKALSNPINFADLHSFLTSRKKVLVVVNDQSRPTPTREVLALLELRGKDVTTVVATGAHRLPTKPELLAILGGTTPPYGGSIVTHNARDETRLVYLGRTSRGTEVHLNKLAFEADGLIVIGSVEPHYFAGFTGGRKFLLPGLAGFRSIEMNHSLALDAKSKLMVLDGNPIHEDFMDALNLFGRDEDIFSIQLVTNFEHRIIHVSAGHIVDSFTRAARVAKRTYSAPIKSKADIVMTVARPPFDIDLYQSQKAIENAKMALKNGGVVVLVSKCGEGIGDRGFYDLMASGGDILRKIREGYRLGYHKAAKFVELMQRAQIWAVTDLPPTTLERIGIRPFNDIQSAVTEATKLLGRGSSLLLVPDGGLTYPAPRSRTSVGRSGRWKEKSNQ
jgi:nickel-dependent lactate racemase